MSDLQKLLDGLPRGTRSRIARECNVTPGAVTQWKRVPAEYVRKVEGITGISRHVLRTDVFGKKSESAA